MRVDSLYEVLTNFVCRINASRGISTKKLFIAKIMTVILRDIGLSVCIKNCHFEKLTLNWLHCLQVCIHHFDFEVQLARVTSAHVWYVSLLHKILDNMFNSRNIQQGRRDINIIICRTGVNVEIHRSVRKLRHVKFAGGRAEFLPAHCLREKVLFNFVWFDVKLASCHFHPVYFSCSRQLLRVVFFRTILA